MAFEINLGFVLVVFVFIPNTISKSIDNIEKKKILCYIFVMNLNFSDKMH